MAAFTYATAESRVKSKGPAGDRTWVNAYTGRTAAGAPCICVQRYMSPSNPANGGWVELTDDGAT